MNNGLFITLEGTEGVGKSTHLRFLEHWLRDNNQALTVTREPGGTAIAEKIRKILVNSIEEPLNEMTELLLVFAARSQHIENVIRPALARGDTVISDRFVDATYAYQGGGRGIAVESINNMTDLVLKGLKPDITFLFDMPVELAFERVAARDSNFDRFESEHISFFERVRKSYLNRAQQDSERFIIIDASQTIEVIQAELVKHLKKSIAAPIS